MDLARWSREDYRISFFRSLMLGLGAKPYRCEYCRVNFVSFRRRKEKYDPQRRRAQRKRTQTAVAARQAPTDPPDTGKTGA